MGTRKDSLQQLPIKVCNRQPQQLCKLTEMWPLPGEKVPDYKIAAKNDNLLPMPLQSPPQHWQQTTSGQYIRPALAAIRSSCRNLRACRAGSPIEVGQSFLTRDCVGIEKVTVGKLMDILTIIIVHKCTVVAVFHREPKAGSLHWISDLFMNIFQ